MASSRILKDPDEVRPIPINWRASLSKSDAIVTSVWTVTPSGQLVLSSETKGQLSTVALASAGDVGITYEVMNRITSQLGFVLEKTIPIRIQNRVG